MTKPLSELMREAADGLPDGSVSLAEVLALLRHRSTGPLLLLISIPAILPTPGIPAGMLFGSCMVLISLRMLIGSHPVTLPRRFADMRGKPELAAWMLRRGSALLARLERVMRPRLRSFVRPAMQPVLGAAVLIMGVIIALPIPFGNHLPGLAVMAIGAGLASRDGLAVLAGLGLSVVSAGATVGLVWIGYEAAGGLLG